jgi:YfiH family protein
MISPDWPAPAGVRALDSTRAEGDLGGAFLPANPAWMKQVHGNRVLRAEQASSHDEADASFTRVPGVVCVVKVADCMPVFFTDDAGSVVGAAHAGWRGLSAGVLENTVAAMGVAPARLFAWLGPAIGPRVYEVGEDVRTAFAGHEYAFAPARPGHWLLDLYAVARQRLLAAGVRNLFGGSFCTYTDKERFFSFRRDRDQQRMAAAIWLT